MNASVNRQVLLVEKPAGKLGPEHFKLTNAAIPEPKDGEALLRVRYISLDAANRAWMHGATYRSAVEANAFTVLKKPVTRRTLLSTIICALEAAYGPGSVNRTLSRFPLPSTASETATIDTVVMPSTRL